MQQLKRPVLLLLLLCVLSVGGQAPQVRARADNDRLSAIICCCSCRRPRSRGGSCFVAQETFDEELLLKPLGDNHLLVSDRALLPPPM
jgi:hypothetical protein